MHKSTSGRDFPVYDETFRPTKGYWSLYAVETFASVMELVPNDAEIEFEVALDGEAQLLAKLDEQFAGVVPRIHFHDDGGLIQLGDSVGDGYRLADARVAVGHDDFLGRPGRFEGR